MILASDQSDAQVFYFIEKYQDEKAVEFHRAAEYFQTPRCPQLIALRGQKPPRSAPAPLWNNNK